MERLKCPFCNSEFTLDMLTAKMCFVCGETFENMNIDEKLLVSITEEYRSEFEKKEAEEKKKRETEEKEKKEAEEKRIESLIRQREYEYRTSFKVTTGYDFEGFQIKKYLNLVHAEVVLGTGFLSELSATVNDFLGTSSGTTEGKLSKAKSIVENQLINKAKAKGANAIIGADFDISTLFDNMIVVSGNATAVVIEYIEENTKE